MLNRACMFPSPIMCEMPTAGSYQPSFITSLLLSTRAGTFAGKWVNCVNYVGKSRGLAIHVPFVAKGICVQQTGLIQCSWLCLIARGHALPPLPQFEPLCKIYGQVPGPWKL
jgi:hypothetical protein